jgi:excinuclease ABC subunit C
MTPVNAKALVENLSDAPGIYRMLDVQGEVLYVGKARNLRKRVASYFRKSGLTERVRLLMQQVTAVEISITHTENEALLLENNLIKSLRPRFNILLRDDKSYPYIFLSDDKFPRLGFHRGAKHDKGRYFGPFPSAASVRESLNLLQKVFPVRQCENSFFRNRSRPCLQYQIKRCSAPCVGYIDADNYRDDVRHVAMFLDGQSRAVIQEMIAKMETTTARRDYENAARYRDRIAALRRVQERQYISSDAGGEADVIALAVGQGAACVSVTFIRNGLNLGAKHFFPKIGAAREPEEILSSFLPQYYLGKAIPSAIYTSHAVPDRALLERAFTDQAKRKVAIAHVTRGLRRRWLKLAELNAAAALRRYLNDKLSLHRRFEALQEALKLDALPERIECFDISHTLGEATVAACVAFSPDGPLKSDYRRFNIEGVPAGDDYGAMTQALLRRYRRAVEQGADDGAKLPDLVLIDGGKGQLAAAAAALEELQVRDMRLVAVAKGRERKPGEEQVFIAGSKTALRLPNDSPALHLIQQIRDEAHRFAIAGHRQRRAKARGQSPLEQIPGIGQRRRQALLKNLGGLQEVARAGVDDLTRVPGISPELAQRIYQSFHPEG